MIGRFILLVIFTLALLIGHMWKTDEGFRDAIRRCMKPLDPDEDEPED